MWHEDKKPHRVAGIRSVSTPLGKAFVTINENEGGSRSKCCQYCQGRQNGNGIARSDGWCSYFTLVIAGGASGSLAKCAGSWRGLAVRSLRAGRTR
jgi:hypothetical protein